MRFLKDQTNKIQNIKHFPFSYKFYLYEKKKCSKIYGNLKHHAIFHYCKKARQFSGKVENNLLFFFERRLDVALYRIFFSETIAKARQMIVHGKVSINGKIILNPSYLLSPGDVIKLDKANFCRIKKIKKIQQKINIQKKSLFRSFKRQLRQKHRKKKKHQIFKSLHFEVNYAGSLAIFLFFPQKLFLPAKINGNFIDRNLR